MTSTKSDYLSDQEVEARYPLTASFLRADRYTKRYNIPFLRIGRKIRYQRSDIEKFLEQCRQAEGRHASP